LTFSKWFCFALYFSIRAVILNISMNFFTFLKLPLTIVISRSGCKYKTLFPLSKLFCNKIIFLLKKVPDHSKTDTHIPIGKKRRSVVTIACLSVVQVFHFEE